MIQLPHQYHHHQVSGLSMLLVAQISKLNLSAYPVWIVCLIVCFMTGLRRHNSLSITMCHNLAIYGHLESGMAYLGKWDIPQKRYTNVAQLSGLKMNIEVMKSFMNSPLPYVAT